MPTLQTGSGALRINVPRGSTLIIRNQSGAETVTGSSAAREDATFALGAGAVVYGPQSSSSDVSITTTGVLTYDIVAGDATPATDDVRVSRNAATGAAGGLVDGTGQPVGGSGATFNRVPTTTDNASLGYNANSLWLADDTTYQPIAAPTTTEAAWAQVPTPGGSIGDLFGANLVSAYGTIPLVAGFTGQAVEVITTRGAAPATTAVNVLASGELDEVAVGQAIALADSGTAIRGRLFDQKGTNHSTAPGTNGSQAMFLNYDPDLGYVLNGDSQSAGGPFYLGLPDTLSVAENNYTLIVLGRVTTTSIFNSAVAMLGDPGTAACNMLSAQTDTGLCIYAKTGANPIKPGAQPGQVTPCVIAVSKSAGSTTIMVNEDVVTQSVTSASGTLLGGSIGARPGFLAASSSTTIVGVLVINRAATAAELQKVRQMFYRRFEVRPQNNNEVYLLGDSRFALNTQGRSPAYQLSQYLQGEARIYPMGVSSQTVAGALSNVVTPMIVPRAATVAGKKVAVILLGINYFLGTLSGTPGLTTAQVQAAATTPLQQLKDIITALRGAGVRTVLVSELAASSGYATAGLPALRSLILSEGAAGMGCDEIVTVSDLSFVMAATNTTFYPDGIHPVNAVMGAVMQRCAPVVDRLLAQ